MAIDYTSTTSSLQVRLGKLIGVGVDLRSQQGSTLTNINEVRAAYTATTIDREEYVGPLASEDSEELVDGMARTLQTYVRDGMERTIIRTVSEGLREVNNATDALRLLATDMIANSQAISTTAISISAQTATATGSGAFSVSSGGQYVYGGAKYTSKQTQNDSILPEKVSARCIKDARDGSLILGNERFEIEGQAAVDRLDRRWQDNSSGYGSGARVLLNSTCGSIEASSIRGQNMLSNGGMERVNGTPFPLDWQIQTGTEGTNLIADTSGARGTYSMSFTGNGSVLHNVYEVMGQGPRPNIKTNTVYIVSALLRAKGSNVTAGTFALQLRDSSNTEISGCSVARNFASSNLATGSWVRLVGSFTTPLTLGSGTRFAMAFTVALGNTQNLLVDEVVLTEAAELYAGGPKIALLAGTADWELDDRLQVDIAKTTSSWQVNLDRYLDLAGRGIQLPTSATTATNTWADSLFT
jgi:hypothetical protein